MTWVSAEPDFLRDERCAANCFIAGNSPSQAAIDLADEFRSFKWFIHVTVRSEITTKLAVSFLCFGCKKNKTRQRGIAQLLKAKKHLMAIHSGHSDVAKHQVRLIACNALEAMGTIHCTYHSKTFQLQNLANVFADLYIIFYNQHLQHNVAAKVKDN